MEAYAIHKNAMIKPRLARMTMDLIRGKSVDEARAILETTNTKAIAKLAPTLHHESLINSSSANFGLPTGFFSSIFFAILSLLLLLI